MIIEFADKRNQIFQKILFLLPKEIYENDFEPLQDFIGNPTFHQTQWGSSFIFLYGEGTEHYLVLPKFAARYKSLCFRLLVYQRTVGAKVKLPVAKEFVISVRVFSKLTREIKVTNRTALYEIIAEIIRDYFC